MSASAILNPPSTPPSGGTPPSGNTPPSTSPTGGGTPPPTPPSGEGKAWYGDLAPELQSWIQNKGYADLSAMASGHQNLEKLLGVKEKLLHIPDKDDAPEWKEIWDKLGRPQKPEEYTFKDLDKENPEFAKWAKERFHELGMSRKQAEGWMAKWTEHVKSTMKAREDQQLTQFGDQVRELKKEWGAAYDQNLKLVDKAAVQFGISDEMVDALKGALGPAGALKLLQAMGSKLGEDTIPGTGSGGSVGGALTPAQAKAQIYALGGDTDFIRRYAEGGIKEAQEMDRLHKMAYPEAS